MLAELAILKRRTEDSFGNYGPFVINLVTKKSHLVFEGRATEPRSTWKAWCGWAHGSSGTDFKLSATPPAMKDRCGACFCAPKVKGYLLEDSRRG